MTSADQSPNEPRAGTLRAVLDTSVLMSEHRHWLWRLAADALYEGAWSTFIVAELVRVRVRLSMERGIATAIYRERINTLVHQLSDVLIVAPYRTITLGGALADPDDDPILATALAAGAGLIVSLNVRHFPPEGTLMGVRFVTPLAFLDLLDMLYPDGTIHRQAGEAGRQLP